MMNTNITIIIPVYNAEAYIRQCLNSIINQTIDSKEIICIDDGSTDSSAKILDEYVQKFQYIRVIKQMNQGSGAARNKGLSEAKGKFVAFCDADDFYYDNNALKRMIEACEENGVSICGSYRKTVDNDVILDSLLFRNIKIHDDKGIPVLYLDYQNDYEYQSFIFEKKLLDDNHIVFPHYLRYQDPPFFVNAMIKAERFWVVPVELYCYRFGHQNMEANSKKIKYVLMGIKDNIKLAIQYGYENLYKLLVEDRLNKQYYITILENLSDEVIRLLLEIQSINKNAKHCLEIKAITNLYKYKLNCSLWGKEDAIQELDNYKNHSFEIFRKTALLKTHGISFADILSFMEIKAVYIHGAGEIGQMFLSDIYGQISIESVFDFGNINVVQVKDGTEFISIPLHKEIQIPENEIPIIVTPSAAFQEISYTYIEKGIKRERIISLHTILSFGMKYMLADNSEKTLQCDKVMRFSERRQFLITGAQFCNKGAQSMLFITVSEIRKRFHNAIIWYLPVDGKDVYTKELQKSYDFFFLLDGNDIKSQLFEIITGLTAIVDISGYALSSYWENEWYIKNLRIAYHYNIPMYIMPQSFGPFQFSDEKQKDLKKYISGAKMIYVREKEAYELLKGTYELDNIKLSKDIVLQNKNINTEYIYATNNVKTLSLNTDANVAVIPNVRNYEFGSAKEVLELYRLVIDFLLRSGKKIYIFSYSNDEKACEDIYAAYKNEERVHIFLESLDCIEYSLFMKNFQYIITSRFHSIVHAYKVYVPCIAIGWARKYEELLNSFEQGQYVFDVCKKIDNRKLLGALDAMNNFYTEESKKIQNLLPFMQQENCFDILEELKA